jgi:hypothetical protein
LISNETREDQGQNSPIFLRIRQSALEKAFNQIRYKRLELDEKKAKGWITESDYKNNILNLMKEGTNIICEQKQITEKMKQKW